MIKNKKMLDIDGNQIKEGSIVTVSQFAQSIFHIEKIDEKDLYFYKTTLPHIYSNFDGEFTYKKYSDTEYIVCRDGKPFGMEIPEVINNKTVFMMSSEHDIPEMDVKKGDMVLCFGGEGYAAGVFRYDRNTLKLFSYKGK